MEGLIVTIEQINAMLKESHKANVKSIVYLKRSGFLHRQGRAFGYFEL